MATGMLSRCGIRLLLAILLALAPADLARCAARAAGPQVMFGKTSPFNQRIDAAEVDPGTGRVIATLLSTNQGINLNTGAWTPTVYYAKPSSPTTMVRLSNGSRVTIPMPRSVAPSNDADGHAEIVARKNGSAYAFYQLDH